jgi:hypothetical protein
MLDVIISDTARPAPSSLHNCLKGLSVTPAMGASIRLFFSVIDPIFMHTPLLVLPGGLKWGEHDNYI